MNVARALTSISETGGRGSNGWSCMIILLGDFGRRARSLTPRPQGTLRPTFPGAAAAAGQIKFVETTYESPLLVICPCLARHRRRVPRGGSAGGRYQRPPGR